MKTLQYSLCLFALFIFPVIAQAKIGNSSYEPPKDGLYFNDRITVRFHDFMRETVEGNQQNDAVLQALIKKWGVQKLTRRFPEAQIPQEKMRYGRPTVDITLIYNLYVTPVTNLRAMIDDFNASGLAQYAEVNCWYKTSQFPVNDPYVTNYQPANNLGQSTWYLYRVGATSIFNNGNTTAWDVTRGDTSVIIATVDSGSDMDHPDLVNTFYINRREIPNNGIDDDNNGKIDDWRGWDFGGGDYTSIVPDNLPTVTTYGGSHGVHVGGIMSAEGDNGIGIAGVAHGCRQLVVKCASDNDDRAGGGAGYISFGYEGISYAAAMGAKVINCSWGGNGGGQAGQDVITNAVLSYGAVIVVAAGNDDTETESFPACYNNVICVAASTLARTNNGAILTDIKASFTNRNAKVDVLAPGVRILSTYFDNAYIPENGTSMASPLTAGCVALIRSHYPWMNPFQVEAQLKSTTTPIYEGTGRDDNGAFVNMAAYRGKLGTGLVNVNNALRQAKPFFDFQLTSLVSSRGESLLARGDTLEISGTLTNTLFNSTANCFAKIARHSGKLRYVGQDSIRIGVSTYNSVINYTPLLRFVIDSVLPPNFDPSIEFDVYDRLVNQGDTFQKIQTIPLNALINSDYVNVGTSALFTSLINNGRIGYLKGYKDGNNGVGFLYNGRDVMSEMGFLAGVSQDSLSDNLRSDTTASGIYRFNDHFKKISSQKLIANTGQGKYYQSILSDSNSTRPLGLEITQTTFISANVADSNFITVRYVVKNKSNKNYRNFKFGLFADWDISTDGLNDRATYNAPNKLGLVQKFEGRRPTAGISLLTNQAFNFYAIENNYAGTSANIISLFNGFSQLEKWKTLSINTQLAAGVDVGVFPNGTDVASVVSGNTPVLNAGDSTIYGFAIIVGTEASNVNQYRTVAANRYTSYLGVKSNVDNVASLVSIYPNPAQGTFSLNLPKGTQASKVIITSINGKEIAQFAAVEANTELNLQHITSGMYLVKVLTDDVWTSHKLMIQ